jgi:hypothetical protein
LSQEALTRYEEFRDQFPEKKVVLVHLTFPVGWDEALYQETLGVLQRFQIFYQEKYPRLESEEESGEEMGRSIEFVHFEDIYRPALKGSGFEGFSGF